MKKQKQKHGSCPTLWAHHEKAGFLEKTITTGKIEGSMKRERPNMR